MGVREGSKNNNKKRSICLIKDRKKKEKIAEKKKINEVSFFQQMPLCPSFPFFYFATQHTQKTS